jgi:hypothetical protein
MTLKDIALRTLWHAGRYLEKRVPYLHTEASIKGNESAVLIIANAYNRVLGESHVSGKKSLQR